MRRAQAQTEHSLTVTHALPPRAQSRSPRRLSARHCWITADRMLVAARRCTHSSSSTLVRKLARATQAVATARAAPAAAASHSLALPRTTFACLPRRWMSQRTPHTPAASAVTPASTAAAAATVPASASPATAAASAASTAAPSTADAVATPGAAAEEDSGGADADADEAPPGSSWWRRWTHERALPLRWSLGWWKEMALIFTVFGITGSGSMYIVRPMLHSVAGLEGSMKDGPWSYRLISLAVLMPAYSLMLVSIGTIAGRHHYFKRVALRMWGRLLPLHKLGIKARPPPKARKANEASTTNTKKEE